MIVVSVLYPSQDNTTFDLDYYVKSHLPLVRRLLEPAGMRSLTYYQPIDAGAPPPFRLVAELRFDDMETTQKALDAHGPETQADIANFTDSTPSILIGEEVAG